MPNKLNILFNSLLIPVLLNPVSHYESTFYTHRFHDYKYLLAQTHNWSVRWPHIQNNHWHYGRNRGSKSYFNQAIWGSWGTLQAYLTGIIQALPALYSDNHGWVHQGGNVYMTEVETLSATGGRLVLRIIMLATMAAAGDWIYEIQTIFPVQGTGNN